MLADLLDIKRRRERGQRALLVRLAEEDRRLESRQRALQARRLAVRADWRALTARRGSFDPDALARLRAAQGALDAEDHALRQQLDALLSERTQLAQTRAEQEGLLRTILRSQEKLISLQESVI